MGKFWNIFCYVFQRSVETFLRFISVREKIGPIATPDFIQNAPALPKTRSGNRGAAGFQANMHLFDKVTSAFTSSSSCLSGKIMRRILRQVACNEKDLGDLSTLSDPKVVEVLFSQRCEAAA